MDDTLNNNNSPTVPPKDENLDPTSHVPTTEGDLQTQDNNPEDLDSRWLRWKCLNCGYLYEGVNELKRCPRCGNENPDLFQDAD